MGAGQLVGFAIRMVVSLGVVIGLVAAVWWWLRRGRAGIGRRSGTAGMEVLARTAVTRTTAIVAVRAADRVLITSVSDGAPSALLAELDYDDWLADTAYVDDGVTVEVVDVTDEELADDEDEQAAVGHAHLPPPPRARGASAFPTSIFGAAKNLGARWVTAR